MCVRVRGLCLVPRQVVQGSMRSVSTSSGPEKRLGDDVHFNKRKGVVNTLGGAKDFGRHAASAAAAAAEPMRKSDALRSGGVHTLSSAGSAGSTRSVGSQRTAASAPDHTGKPANTGKGVYTFKQLEHDAKPGLRKGDGLGGGAGASVTTAPGKTGHMDGFQAIAPTKKPPKASSVATGAKGTDALAAPKPAASHASSHVLGGGGSSGGSGGSSGAGMSDREKRAAYFEKQAAAAKAK